MTDTPMSKRPQSTSVYVFLSQFHAWFCTTVWLSGHILSHSSDTSHIQSPAFFKELSRPAFHHLSARYPQMFPLFPQHLILILTIFLISLLPDCSLLWPTSILFYSHPVILHCFDQLPVHDLPTCLTLTDLFTISDRLHVAECNPVH